MKIIAIIPAYNEESTIGDVIKSTSQFVDEILMISDESTDNTSDIAKKADEDIIVQIDADGQYDPQEIPKLIQPILDNKAGLVLGSRFENLKYEMPWLKKKGQQSFYMAPSQT